MYRNWYGNGWSRYSYVTWILQVATPQHSGGLLGTLLPNESRGGWLFARRCQPQSRHDMTLPTDGFAPLLTALAAGSQQYFGDSHAILEPVARLDRPFSNLLRLRVTAGGRESHAFLKVFKPQRSTPEELAKLRSYAEREFSATKSLYDAIDTRSGLTALRPVALFVEDMAIVTEEVAGTGFDRVLRDALWGRQTVAPIDAVAERIGAWVRTYQRVIEVEGELSLDERREYLDLRLRKLMDAAGPHCDSTRDGA